MQFNRYLNESDCNVCGGDLIRKEVLSVIIAGKNINDIMSMIIDNYFDFFSNISFDKNKRVFSDYIIKDLINRLSFLKEIGVSYLSLNRSSNTLSGGEFQRVRLATQIGSALSGVVYVLDEPSIGLHQRDNVKLINIMKSLRDLGNTVIVIEHDEETIRAADYIIEIGPAAGVHGGEVVAQGVYNDIIKDKVTELLESKFVTLIYLTLSKSKAAEPSTVLTAALNSTKVVPLMPPSAAGQVIIL